jgi:hypothetical protein
MYSLLWTHAPKLYEHYGWAPIEQDRIYASLPAPSQPCTLHEFTEDDFPDVMYLYDRTNRRRSGPTVRSPEYWRAQLTWTHEDRSGFLIARHDCGEFSGYIRSRSGGSRVEVLELGVEPDSLPCGRDLVNAAAHRRTGEIEAQFPPSVYDVVPATMRQIAPAPGLMGRTLDAQSLFNTLEPVLIDRAPGSGNIRTRLASLSEADLGHLLFHGYDPVAARRFGHLQDADVLRSLFPEQDFIIWPSDAF